MSQDIRWEQRFSNFKKALNKLTEAVNYISRQDKLEGNNAHRTVFDEMLKEGLIQRFEYTHELAWNVMKDYAIYQGITNVGGSRDAAREAFQLNLVPDGQVWMDMISSRNKTSHTYNVETADEIFDKIMNDYYQAFLDFESSMNEKIHK